LRWFTLRNWIITHGTKNITHLDSKHQLSSFGFASYFKPEVKESHHVSKMQGYSSYLPTS